MGICSVEDISYPLSFNEKFNDVFKMLKKISKRCPVPMVFLKDTFFDRFRVEMCSMC